MNVGTRSRKLLAALTVALAFPTTAMAQLMVSPERPLVGQPLTVTKQDSEVLGDSASATFAPGTVVPREMTLQDESSAPGFQWTPDAPGLWQLSIGDSSITIVVAREGVPIPGLLVLIVAATSLIFLSAWGLGRKS